MEILCPYSKKCRKKAVSKKKDGGVNEKKSQGEEIPTTFIVKYRLKIIRILPNF